MKVRLPQGMGGGPSNMQSMIKQAQKMQEDMAALQEDLDAREIRFRFKSEKNVTIPCHLCIPKGAEGKKLPLMITLQGHSTGMHISLGRPIYPGDEQDCKGGDRDFAIRAVKEGFATLCIEQRCMGECGSKPDGHPNCNHPALQAILLGRTLIGERCWDISRTIDALPAHFPQLDMNRIAIMGNSGGGTAAPLARKTLQKAINLGL